MHLAPGDPEVDALREVAAGVMKIHNENRGILIITHYQRILGYVQPDFVHIMLGGRVVEEGGAELATQLEEKGYDWVRERHDPGEELAA